MKQVFFIVSSGRSGTQALQRVLNTSADAEVHHEYLCTHVQPLAMKYYLGFVPRGEACRQLGRLHGAAVNFSARRHWGDSSNKLSWLIEPLAELFPDARFIHLVRDGRKVVSSFFHKLSEECYEQAAWQAFVRWSLHPQSEMEPPPEKRYWWPRPRDLFTYPQWQSWSRFERLCFCWQETHQEIERGLQGLPAERVWRIRLEDLIGDPGRLKMLAAFLQMNLPTQAADLLRRPHNVHRPEDFPLDAQQTSCFWRMCAPTMARYGYDGDGEYRVNYHPDGW